MTFVIFEVLLSLLFILFRLMLYSLDKLRSEKSEGKEYIESLFVLHFLNFLLGLFLLLWLFVHSNENNNLSLFMFIKQIFLHIGHFNNSKIGISFLFLGFFIISVFSDGILFFLVSYLLLFIFFILI